jgi:hypothetical protein
VKDLRFDVLTAVKMSIAVFGVVTPCSLVDDYRHFEGTCCLHIQGRGDFYPEDRGDAFLRTFGNHIKDYTVSQSRRPQSTIERLFGEK